MEIYSELHYQNGVRQSNAQLELLDSTTFATDQTHNVAGKYIINENNQIQYKGSDLEIKTILTDAVESITVGETTLQGAGTFVGNGINIAANDDTKIITFTHPSIEQHNTRSTETPDHGGSFSVIDNVTRDEKGHVLGVNTKTINLPSGINTDEKVAVDVDETTSTDLPLLFGNSNAAYIGGVKMNTGVSVNPLTQVLNAKSLSANNCRFNNSLAYYNSTTPTVTGTLCITLPNTWIRGMNIYKINVYDYTFNPVSSYIIGGHDYATNSGSWERYSYNFTGNTDNGVRLGYNSTLIKCVILIGNTKSTWSYPQIWIEQVLTGCKNQTLWQSGYSIDFVRDESFLDPEKTVICPKNTQAIDISGTAATATTLQDAKFINGINFNGSASVNNYALCSTAQSTQAKTAEIANYVLAVGSRATIKFANTNARTNPTLNISSTGAKAIYYEGNPIPASYLIGGQVYEFVYNGVQYDLVGMINTNTTYSIANTTTAGLILSGNDITVDANGLVSVNDNSHNHYSNTITKMTGYVTATEEAIIDTSDSLNDAIGKLELAVNNRVKNLQVSFIPGNIDLASFDENYTGIGRTGISIQTAIRNSPTEIPTSQAVYNYINDIIITSGYMHYKGTLGTGGTVTSLPAIHTVGDVYIVKTAGIYGTFDLEVGDMVVCNTSGTTSNNAHWDDIQSNIDGAVITDDLLTNNCLLFGAGGNKIKPTEFVVTSEDWASNKAIPTCATLRAYYLNKNGGIMRGFITLHSAPTDDMHAATKKYVDDCCGAGLKRFEISVNGSTGTIHAADHGCGILPIVSARTSSGNVASLSFSIDASGNVAWRSTSTFNGQIYMIG